MKSRNLLIWSALPSNVRGAKVVYDVRPYSCKKIGRGIPARFLRFTNFHRCSYLCKYPQTPSAWGGSGGLLGFALQVATRGEFGGLRRSFARLVHGGYHLAVELLEAALGIREAVFFHDAVEDEEHLGFLEFDRIGGILVADPLVGVGRVLHEYIVAELQLLLGFEQSRFDFYASDRER